MEVWVGSQGPLTTHPGEDPLCFQPLSSLAPLQGPEEHRPETLQEESQEETHGCKEPPAGRGPWQAQPHSRAWACLLCAPGPGVGPVCPSLATCPVAQRGPP